MAFTVTDFIDAKRALDQIAIDAQAHGANVDRGVEQVAQSAALLQGMQGSWTAAVQQIKALVAANPNNKQWQALDAELDMMIVAFQAKRDRAIAIRDAAQAAG